MPNWCTNYIEVSGNSNTIQRLADAVEKGALLRTMTDGDIGVKWEADVVDTYIENDHDDDCKTFTEGFIDITFLTAWTPPVPAIEAFVKENPDVTVDYWYKEEGMELIGHLVGQKVECYNFRDEGGLPPALQLELDDIRDGQEHAIIVGQMKRTDFTMSDFTQNIIVAIAIMVVLSPVLWY